MTNKEKLEILNKKGASLGRAQGIYMIFAIITALVPFVAPEYSTFVPFGVSAFVLAWFGISRAAGEVTPVLKSLYKEINKELDDRDLMKKYNYGLYGGAPPFVWAMFYAPHGTKRSFNRFWALLSYPLVFTLIIASAVMTINGENPYLYIPQSIALVTSSIFIIKLWVNRIKAI